MTGAEPRITVADLQAVVDTDVPVMADLGIRVLAVGWGTCQVHVPYSDRMVRPGGTISGPVMMGIADLVMFGCVLSRIGLVKLAVTTNLTANFLKKPPPSALIADGRLLKCGRRLAYGEVSILTEGADDPVCHVTSTYAIPEG